MRYCDTVWGGDCEYYSTVKCFRCGLNTCKGCSVKIPYLKYGVKRIGLDCLDEMVRHGDLDEYIMSQTLMPVLVKHLFGQRIKCIDLGVIVTGVNEVISREKWDEIIRKAKVTYL